MDNKYPKHVIDYAIDNKVSLEEAYKHYIMHGEEKKEEEKQDVSDFNIEEEEKFLSELEEKIKADTDDEQWWAEWQEKMRKIEEMEKELGVERDNVITKEEYEWVEAELEQVDKLYDEMYGKNL